MRRLLTSAGPTATLLVAACAGDPELASVACPVEAWGSNMGLVRSPEELSLACSEMTTGAESVDWTTTVLLPVVLDDTASIERVTVRGSMATVHIERRPYCAGTPPPPPHVVFVLVPANVETSERKSHSRGRCPPGPPPV